MGGADAVYEVRESEDLVSWDVLNTVTGDGSVMAEDIDVTGINQWHLRVQTVE